LTNPLFYAKIKRYTVSVIIVGNHPATAEQAAAISTLFDKKQIFLKKEER